ncbi:DNA-binding protein [Paenibacillus aceti]|uniref:Helix-turn-helix domain-containing protein n=1 Tax=Paenibacillus aceti TaxID=1820010 RepID=A0ABQ1VTL8_9BACL|nr:DNA-binding protein [Paenibacillus aceti]GGF97911.1 hypothetical protein GCM10010913_19600 [Paenibacillus aceti]
MDTEKSKYITILRPLDYIMDVKEAAKLWNNSPSYVKDLCRLKLKKKGMAIKKGNTWIINKSNVTDSNNPLLYILDAEEAAVRWNYSPSYVKDLCRESLEEKGYAIKKGKTWILDANQPNPKLL